MIMRRAGLRRLQRKLERPMVFLGWLWLALLVVELAGASTPGVKHLSAAIWILFWIDFFLRFSLVSDKREFIRSNGLMLAALAIPALRILRPFRAIEAARSAQLARIPASIQQTMPSFLITPGPKSSPIKGRRRRQNRKASLTP